MGNKSLIFCGNSPKFLDEKLTKEKHGGKRRHGFQNTEPD